MWNDHRKIHFSKSFKTKKSQAFLNCNLLVINTSKSMRTIMDFTLKILFFRPSHKSEWTQKKLFSVFRYSPWRIYKVSPKSEKWFKSQTRYLWNHIIKTLTSPHSVNKFENFRFTAPSQTSSNSACRWIPKSSEKSRSTFRTSSASRQSLRIRLRLRWWICWTICTPVLTPPSTLIMFIRLVFFNHQSTTNKKKHHFRHYFILS